MMQNQNQDNMNNNQMNNQMQNQMDNQMQNQSPFDDNDLEEFEYQNEEMNGGEGEGEVYNIENGEGEANFDQFVNVRSGCTLLRSIGYARDPSCNLHPALSIKVFIILSVRR